MLSKIVLEILGAGTELNYNMLDHCFTLQLYQVLPLNVIVLIENALKFGRHGWKKKQEKKQSTKKFSLSIKKKKIFFFGSMLVSSPVSHKCVTKIEQLGNQEPTLVQQKTQASIYLDVNKSFFTCLSLVSVSFFMKFTYQSY